MITVLHLKTNTSWCWEGQPTQKYFQKVRKFRW